MTASNPSASGFHLVFLPRRGCPRRNASALLLVVTATAVAAGAFFPAAASAVDRTWDGGASGAGSSWTASTGANWNPNGLPTTADNLFLNNSIVTVPTTMTIATSDIGALTITFANNFNPSNTTVIGDGGTGNRILTLGSAGNNWSLTNNATSGTVTFQPQSTPSDGLLSMRLASNGTVSVASGGAVVLTIPISETGSGFGLTKIGAGTLSLGGIGSFTGTSSIQQGGVTASINSALGAGDVGVSSLATLTLASTVTNAIADTATLTLGGTGASAAKLNLTATSGIMQETVGALVLGTTAQAPGTYGATGSGAANINDTYFTGGGILTVVPEPSSWLASAVGAVGLLVLLRRRSSRNQRA